MAVMAAVCLATGLGQPAKALGGGVVVSQATPGSGDTVVAVSGNIVNPGTGYGYTAGQSVNFNFTVANSFVGGTSSWNGGVDPYYFFDSVDYTALSGNTFTGTFNAANTTAGSLEIYKSGLVRFDILATSPPYTGLALIGADAPTALNRYSVQFNVGSNFAAVPDSSPGSIPTIASLLSGAIGSYQVSSGEISRPVETLATYASVPGPLPIVGVGVAFSQSRRLRKRIKSRQSNCC